MNRDWVAASDLTPAQVAQCSDILASNVKPGGGWPIPLGRLAELGYGTTASGLQEATLASSSEVDSIQITFSHEQYPSLSVHLLADHKEDLQYSRRTMRPSVLLLADGQQIHAGRALSAASGQRPIRMEWATKNEPPITTDLLTEDALAFIQAKAPQELIDLVDTHWTTPKSWWRKLFGTR